MFNKKNTSFLNKIKLKGKIKNYVKKLEAMLVKFSIIYLKQL